MLRSEKPLARRRTRPSVIAADHWQSEGKGHSSETKTALKTTIVCNN